MRSFIILVIEFTISTILKELGINPISNVLALIFIIVFSIAFSCDLDYSVTFNKYKQSLLLGYYLRVFLLLFDRYGQSIYHLPNSGADSEMFYTQAVLQAKGITSVRSGGFIGLFRILFGLIGTNRLIGQFIVVLFSLVALCVLALTLEELDLCNEQKQRVVAIVALLPNYAILSSIFLRESIVSMFVCISFYFFMRFYNGYSFINVIFSFICVLCGMLFHSGPAGFIIGYTTVLLLGNRDSWTLGKRGVSILVAIVFGIGSVYLYTRYGDLFFAKFLRVDSIVDVANVRESGGSTYAKYVGNSDSVKSMIVYTIPRYVYFLFSPFPWQWRGPADIIAFFFSGFYYMSIVYQSICYLISGKDKNRTLIVNVLIILACSTFVFAWGVSNTGTAARHRDKLITAFAILHGLVLDPDRSINLYMGDRKIV